MNPLSPERGQLLIAEPFLSDSNFSRSVILLCDHSENGSFGLVLNQNINLKISDVLDNTYAEAPLFLGGPVGKNTLHFIHRLGHLIADSIPLGTGLYWDGNFTEVLRLLNLGVINQADIRFFVGYSGWESGQLERELKQNIWISTVINAVDIFETPSSELWRQVLKNMGGEYKVLSNYPLNPRMN